VTDRRSFLARLSGAVAGLVAGKHVLANPASGQAAGYTVDAVPPEARPVTNLDTSYTVPSPKDVVSSYQPSRTYVGSKFGGVTVDGHALADVFSVTDYGYPHRLDGSFWGKVVTLTACRDADDAMGYWRSDFNGTQEFHYTGWVRVGRWPADAVPPAATRWVTR
jgi:hypothetical protein